MLRSLYSGISGMRGFQTKLDVIGNNIANVNTTGFKSGRVMFKDIMSQTIQGAGAPSDGGDQVYGGKNAMQIGLGSTLSAIDTIMNDGSAQVTNRPLDFAIQGNGFFTVTNGTDTLYTRAGNFYFDNAGSLVTADGWQVVGADGAPIQIDGIDTIKSFAFDDKGVLTIVDAEGETATAGQIGLTTFANPAGLEKAGGSLFKASPNSGEAGDVKAAGQDGAGTFLVGSLEMSNVDLTNEFSEMIVAQRGFQANSRTISTADEILQEIVNLKRG